MAPSMFYQGGQTPVLLHIATCERNKLDIKFVAKIEKL